MFPKIKKFTEDVVLGATILATSGVGAWRDFLADKKGQTGTIMAIRFLILTFIFKYLAKVTGAITVLLGVNTTHALKMRKLWHNHIRQCENSDKSFKWLSGAQNAMPPVADDAANTTMATVGSIFYSAVGLVVIGFLVLAAVFIREWVLKPFLEETRCCIQTPRRWGRLNIGFAPLPVIEMR